jgi:hypothetical protein
MHVPAASPPKSPVTHYTGSCVGLRTGLDVVRTGKSIPRPEVKSRFAGRATTRYHDPEDQDMKQISTTNCEVAFS